MDRGARQATVHGVTKSLTQLKQLSRHTCKIQKLANKTMFYFSSVQSLSHVRLFVSPWTVCSTPGSSSQARILEWVAISSSRGSSQPRDRTRISCVSYIGRQIVYHHTTWEETPEIFTDRILWETNNTMNLLIVG